MLRRVQGYASVFGVVDDWGDVVMPGAFCRWLPRQPLPMCLEHRDRVGSWTLLREDDHGLWCEGLTILPRLAVPTGLSICFWTIRSRHRDGVREVAGARLVEVSLVRWPAQEAARLA